MNKTCEQTLELLKDGYLDNELESPEREEINLHLAECSACRSAKENLAALSLALRNAPRLNPPESLWPRIRTEIGNRTPCIKPGGRFYLRFANLLSGKKIFAYAAAAALVLMAVGFHLASRPNADATALSLTAILGNDEIREPTLNFGSDIENHFL